MLSLLMTAPAFPLHAETETNSVQNPTPGRIFSVGLSTYKIRVTGLIDVADSQAMRRASEYCTAMKRTTVIKDKFFDMGYGVLLTWSCVPPEVNSASASDLAPGKIFRVSKDTYTLRVTSDPIDVAEIRVSNKAREYCTTRKRTFVTRDERFDSDYGYTLTWSCLPAQRASIKH
jgi:hypothetical protein